MEGQITELLPFIAHPRVEVRRTAVSHLKALSPIDAGAATRDAMKKTGAAVALTRSVGDSDLTTSKDALAALVNLSDEKEVVVQLVEKTNLVSRLVEGICDKENKLVALYIMLLTNLVIHAEGCRKLLRSGGAGDAQLEAFELLKLLDVFLSSDKGATTASDPYGWLASVLQNVTQVPEGTDLIGEPSRKLLPKLAPFVLHNNPIRRRGVLALFKNCLFHDNIHAWVLSNDVGLLPKLMLALAVDGKNFSAEDCAGMPAEVLAQLSNTNRKRESDTMNKQLIIEALLLLSKTKPGREHMRKSKLYPVLREFHKADGEALNEASAETLGKLVEIMVLDDAPEPIPGKVVAVEASPVNAAAAAPAATAAASSEEFVSLPEGIEEIT